MNLKISKPDGFLPHSLLKICAVIALALTATMSFLSDYNRHPDEIHHLFAVNYYAKNFLPPEYDDPSVRAGYSLFGVSYLNYHWIEYFTAGKFSLILSPFVPSELIRARLFQVLLFVFLISFFWIRSLKEPVIFIFPAILLISPQIWYVFSYVNNDAFALFISMIVAYQLGYEKSLSRQFFDSDSTSKSRGVFFGILIGILFTLKSNYSAFVVFVAFWILATNQFSVLQIKKYCFIALIAISIFALRIGMDFYVNGETNFVGAAYLNYLSGNFEQSRNKLALVQEEIAQYETKPSTFENDLEHSRKEMKLKAKGVSFKEMLFEWGWLRLSSQSFFGVYGYMNIYAKNWFYGTIFLLSILLGVYLFVATVKTRDRESIIQFAIMSSGVFLTILISMMLSWFYAFQPQGRYLFPALAMIVLFVYANRRHLNSKIVNGFIAAMFLLSVFSFIAWGLRKINVEIIAS